MIMTTLNHLQYLDLIYPRLQRVIYGQGKPYITEDERKLNERDIAMILDSIDRVVFRRHFDLFTNRVLSSRRRWINKVDCMLLKGLGPLAKYVSGRVLFVGNLK